LVHRRHYERTEGRDMMEIADLTMTLFGQARMNQRIARVRAEVRALTGAIHCQAEEQCGMRIANRGNCEYPDVGIRARLYPPTTRTASEFRV